MTAFRKAVFAYVMRSRTLGWGDVPGLSGWALHAIPCIFVRRKQRDLTHPEEKAMRRQSSEGLAEAGLED